MNYYINKILKKFIALIIVLCVFILSGCDARTKSLNLGVGKPHVINQTEWVTYGPVITMTCGQERAQPVSVKPDLLTFKTTNGKLIKKKTPLVKLNPPPHLFVKKSVKKGLSATVLKHGLLQLNM